MREVRGKIRSEFQKRAEALGACCWTTASNHYCVLDRKKNLYVVPFISGKFGQLMRLTLELMNLAETVEELKLAWLRGFRTGQTKLAYEKRLLQFSAVVS